MAKIRLKTAKDISEIKKIGDVSKQVFREALAYLKPEMSTYDLDQKVAYLIEKVGKGKLKSAFKNYKPSFSNQSFPGHSCISLNDELTHGVPSKKIIIKKGDLLNLDIGLTNGKYYSDAGCTVCVDKEPKGEVKLLLDKTREALNKAINICKPGKKIGDIGWVIEKVAMDNGLGIASNIGGHGVGFSSHEEPFVANWGDKGTGLKLKPGMVIAIEPFFTLGTDEIIEEDRGFDVIKTADGSLSAQFEHTIAITKEGPLVLV